MIWYTNLRKERKKERKFKFNKNHDSMSTFLNKRIRVNPHNHTPLKLYPINIMKIKTLEIKNPIKLIIPFVMSTFSIHHLTISTKMTQGFGRWATGFSGYRGTN